jgi:hypothetical protein
MVVANWDMDALTNLNAIRTMGNGTIRKCTISWAIDTSIGK